MIAHPHGISGFPAPVAAKAEHGSLCPQHAFKVFEAVNMESKLRTAGRYLLRARQELQEAQSCRGCGENIQGRLSTLSSLLCLSGGR